MQRLLIHAWRISLLCKGFSSTHGVHTLLCMAWPTLHMQRQYGRTIRSPCCCTYSGMARTIYIRCIYGMFGREITKYTVIYGAYLRFWSTLHILRGLIDGLAWTLGPCVSPGLFLCCSCCCCYTHCLSLPRSPCSTHRRSPHKNQTPHVTADLWS